MQELGEFRSLNLWNRVFVNRCREFSNFLSRSPGHRALGPGDADAQISVLLAIRFDAFGLHQPTTEWARHPLQIKDVFMCRTRPNPWHLFFFFAIFPYANIECQQTYFKELENKSRLTETGALSGF